MSTTSTITREQLKELEKAINEGHTKEALQNLETMVPIAEGAGDVIMSAHLHLLLGKALLRTGDLKGSVQAYKKSLDTFREKKDANGIAEALLGLGVVHRWRTDFAMAEEFLEEYLEHVREEGDQPSIGRAHLEMGIVKAEMGDEKAAIAMFNEAINALKNSDDRYQLSRAYQSLGEIYKRMEEYEKALYNLLLGLEIAVEMDLMRNIAYTNASVAECLVRTGDLVRARNHVDKALEIFKESGDVIGLADALRIDGMLWRLGGDLAGAREALEKAFGLIQDKGIPTNELLIRFELGELYIATGDIMEAEAQAIKAVDMARALGRPRFEDIAWKLRETVRKAVAAKTDGK